MYDQFLARRRLFDGGAGEFRIGVGIEMDIRIHLLPQFVHE